MTYFTRFGCSVEGTTTGQRPEMASGTHPQAGAPGYTCQSCGVWTPETGDPFTQADIDAWDALQQSER